MDPNAPARGRGAGGSFVRRRCGFTVLELVLVLLMITLALAMSAAGYQAYLGRRAGLHASELFAQDLRLARAVARRDRKAAAIVFFERGRRYVIRKSTGEVVVERRYDAESDLSLASLDLQLPGDSLAFSGRGIADLSGADGSLGSAIFSTGSSDYEVVFNSMGASDIEEP